MMMLSRLALFVSLCFCAFAQTTNLENAANSFSTAIDKISSIFDKFSQGTTNTIGSITRSAEKLSNSAGNMVQKVENNVGNVSQKTLTAQGTGINSFSNMNRKINNSIQNIRDNAVNTTQALGRNPASITLRPSQSKITGSGAINKTQAKISPKNLPVKPNVKFSNRYSGRR